MTVFPDVPFAQVTRRVSGLWDAENCAHHVVTGESGSGKTTLITDGILPLCFDERQVIFDIKGDDPAWNRYDAEPVERLAPGFGQSGPRRLRLVLDMSNREQAKRLAREALDILIDEGHCVIVIDEARRITDQEELALGARIEALLNSGRSRHVSVITSLTATEWTKPAIRNQWAFSWTGSLKDDEVRKRWLKILGLPIAERAGYLPQLRTIERRQWLYRDAEHRGATALTFLPERG